MKWGDVYDADTAANREGWARLPLAARHVFSALQAEIQREIQTKNPGRFRPLSGWRSDRANRDCGGVVGSRHLYGAALDVAPVEPADTAPPKVCPLKYRVVKSRSWHVEMIE